MQKFSSFPKYSVIDRTKRQPDREVGGRIFVGTTRGSRATSPQERSPMHQSSSSLAPTAAPSEAQPSCVSTVTRWGEEKRRDAEFLPVPQLPHQEPREQHVLLLDTPTA